MAVRARLMVVLSPDVEAQGRRVILRESGISVGRQGEPGRDTLVVRDHEVSRVHFTVAWDAEALGWHLEDHGSHNGTIVDGHTAQRVRLDDGSVIRIGGSLLLFEIIRVGADERLVGERPPLLGPSVAMQRVRGEIELVASRDVPVMILGESGTGKDLAARAVHELSGRSGPFLALNCGGLPEALVESELFGHERGAFTGAETAKIGLFRAADEGSLFLDEIGELPLMSQAKLLRAVDTGEVRPIGATSSATVNARFISATNRDLSEAIEGKTFRGDLFARLGAFIIRIPPLRQRREDVLPLARHFLRADAGAAEALHADVAEALMLYHWPYNVRELRQLLTATAVRAGAGAPMRLEHLPTEVTAHLSGRVQQDDDVPTPPELFVSRDAAPTKESLQQVLAYYRGNVPKVAEFFGRDRRQIYRWAEKHGIDLDAVRGD